MNTNSTDFACLVTGFLTDYLPHHRCYSRNTILSYRDTLKLFLRFLKEEKETSPNSFYIRDFKRELVIEFLEWYRNNGAGITAANQRLGAKHSVIMHSWNISSTLPLYRMSPGSGQKRLHRKKYLS